MMLGRSLIGIAIIGFVLLLAVTARAHEYGMRDGTHQVTVTGLCGNWTAYRTLERDLVVVCPGIQPPAGAVELRAYYVVAP